VTSTRRLAITHQRFDIDAGSCLRLLERLELVDNVAFIANPVRAEIERLMIADGAGKVIFIDISPLEPLHDYDVTVLDHHPRRGADAERNNNRSAACSFELLLREIGGGTLARDRLDEWSNLVRHCDNRAYVDSMDIQKAIKAVHRVRSDEEAYRSWFVPLFDSFMDGVRDINRSASTLRNGIDNFLSAHPDAPSARMLTGWRERLATPSKLVEFRNPVKLTAGMNEVDAGRWFSLLVLGIDSDAADFRRNTQQFQKAYIEILGDTLLISQTTADEKFLAAARSMVYAPDAPEAIKSRLWWNAKAPDRTRGWMLLQVNPNNRNFQVFGNGNKATTQRICDGVIKALRAEVLLYRGQDVAKDEAQLRCAGTLEGTDPLFYNIKPNGFSNILWGSLKFSKQPAEEFGATAEDVRLRIIDIVRQVLDETYFVDWCETCAAADCPIFPWQLSRCIKRREQCGL
jgi:hypothetical protein